MLLPTVLVLDVAGLALRDRILLVAVVGTQVLLPILLRGSGLTLRLLLLLLSFRTRVFGGRSHVPRLARLGGVSWHIGWFGRRGEPMPGVWEAWGADAWVVQVLHFGYRIPFRSRPPLSHVPIPLPSYSPDSIRGLALSDAVCTLVEKEAIKIAPPSPGFYSRLFVTPKVTGGWRPVIDLSRLNGWVELSSFHMKTAQSVLLSLRPGDWMVSLDLQDAYLEVPVHPASRRFLRFCVGGCSVSVSSPVLRPVFSSSGVHPCHGSYIFHHASPRFSSSPLFGRLASPGLHLPGPGACEGLSPLAVSSPLGHSQSFEELFGPDSDVGLSRDDPRDFSFEGFPDPQTGSEVLPPSPGVFV